MKRISPRKQAIIEGRKQYRTGKKCLYGHNSSRYVTGSHCVECDRLWHQRKRDEESPTLAIKRAANHLRLKLDQLPRRDRRVMSGTERKRLGAIFRDAMKVKGFIDDQNT
jgi:hypothetical protein